MWCMGSSGTCGVVAAAGVDVCWKNLGFSKPDCDGRAWPGGADAVGAASLAVLWVPAQHACPLTGCHTC